MDFSLLSNVESLAHTFPIDLDALLRSTEKFGKISLWRMDSSWYCKIEMNTNVIGATFEIKSDHSKNKTPTAAVKDCVERMQAALKTLGKV